MDKILESFEKLLFHLVACVILLPKTIFNTLKPTFNFNYTSEQFALDEKERFRDNISPIILLLGVIALSSYLIFLSEKDHSKDTYFIEEFIHDKDIPILNKLTTLALYLCYFPIQLTCFAVFIASGAYNPALNLITTYNVNWSPGVSRFAAKNNVQYTHRRSMYRIDKNGNFQFKFVGFGMSAL